MEQILTEMATPYDEASVRFRAAHESDRDALLALCAEYRRADHQPEATPLLCSALDAALSGEPLVRLYMIELIEESEDAAQHAAMVVGYLALTLGFSLEAGGRDAFVDELSIAPIAQRRGLGKRALAFADQVCRELGVRRVCLEVERQNQAAHALYHQLGFRDHQRYLLSKVL